MANCRRTPSIYDANRRLPEAITNAVLQEIQDLPWCPKTGYLQSVLLSKFVSDETDPPSVRRQRAINKWLATERNNEATNVRLAILPEDFNILPRVRFDSFVAKVRDIITTIVGEMPEDADLIGGFSGGASTSRRRTESFPASKYLGRADITERALDLFLGVYPLAEAWCNARTSMTQPLAVNVVRGNVLFTVPKTTDIDRCACKEPDLNMFMQRGLGSKIRKCLRRHGIDLNDQSRNRDLARVGSIDGSLATLDLSSASDSVSRELVMLLMPQYWFTVLDTVRSEVTLIDGDEHVNEMFSSMGNGFTFELESLLFYALARATAYYRGISGVISVYGDDIIVPTTLAQDLAWVLDVFGFEVNTKKSYWTGTFRESCGGHYDGGLDVTPVYLRSPLKTYTDLIHFANAIRGWSRTSVGVNDPAVYALWARLRDLLPKSLWGGREYSSITQLVSPHSPKAVLQPRRVRKDPGDGGYFHWLNATTHRVARLNEGTHSLAMVDEPIVTSEMTETIHRYKPVKANRMVPRLADLFFEEICDTESCLT